MMGVPAASATVPGGSSEPSRFAFRSLLTATVLVAMSSTKGCRSRAGAAMAMGLVPKRGSAPKVGRTDGPVAVMHMPTMSCASARIAW